MKADAMYALLAGVAYRSTRHKLNRLPMPEGWSEIEHETETSGFEVISFKRDNEIVIAYAGTGPGLPDWDDNILLGTGVSLSPQLKEAVAYYLEVKRANPQAQITLTGHSLGGGLASLIGVFFDESAVTFDQAPFRASANNDTRYKLINYLTELGYTEGPEISALKDFHSDEPASRSGESEIPGIRGEENTRGVYTKGEVLQLPKYLGLSTIGQQTPIDHGMDSVGAIDLHSHALLTAFLLHDGFRQASISLPHLGRCCLTRISINALPKMIRI